MKERPKMDAPATITDVLSALEKVGSATCRPALCGGALVPVTRDSFKGMERALDVDFEAPNGMPSEGTFFARVACANVVLATMGVGGLTQQGTCARCAGVEKRVRKILAEAAARSGGGR